MRQVGNADRLQEIGVSQTYTAVIEPSGAWWTGCIEEIPGRELFREAFEFIVARPSRAASRRRRLYLPAVA